MTAMGRQSARIGARAVGLLAGLVMLGAAIAGGLAQDAPAPGSLVGRLVVATASLEDPNFARSVIYMVEHDETGALGLVINRPLGEMPLAELAEGIDLEGAAAEGVARVHVGGPVQQTRVFVLHSTDLMLDESRRVTDAVAVTSHADMLRAIAEGKAPKRYLLILGYAGWAPGQLESEFNRGSWGQVPADEKLIFGDDSTKWERAIDLFKIDL